MWVTLGDWGCEGLLRYGLVAMCVWVWGRAGFEDMIWGQ